MRKVLATALREFKATALTKAFIIGTFVVPVVFYAVLGAAFSFGLFNAKKQAVKGTIVVVDSTPGQVVVSGLESFFTKARQEAERQKAVAQVKEISKNMPGPGAKVAAQAAESAVGPSPEVTIQNAGTDADLASFQDRIQKGELLAAIKATPATLVPPGEGASDSSDDAAGGDARKLSDNRYALVIGPEVESQIADKIRDGVADAVLSARFASAGIDRDKAASLMKRPRAESTRITKAGQKATGEDWVEKVVPLIAVVLLLMAILVGASYLLMSTVEEKSSRVMEVLLSGISPMQLLAGKVIGQGSVGLIILVVYGSVAVATASVFDITKFISPVTLALLVAFFLIGYFMFAALFAAVGSAVNDAREAQALQGPLMGVVMLLIYLAIFAGMNDTNSTLMRVLSFIPLSLPFAMSMRVANPAAPPPGWEIAASLAVGVLIVIVFIWAAAKIFRVGVLMYGKPPTLLGLIKWVRYS